MGREEKSAIEKFRERRQRILAEKLLNGESVEVKGRHSKVRSGAACNTRTFKPKSREARIAQYKKDKQLREETLKKRIPFISEEISEGFYLCQGLVLAGGVSGRGKSTVVGNLVAGFLAANEDKTAIVITNEESTEAIYNRIACVLLEKSFMDFQQGRMKSRDQEAVEDMAAELTERVIVVDDEAYDMTCLEDVQAVLEYAAEEGEVGIVVIDYLQTIAFSRENPQMESFQISKQLGLYLKDYGRKVGIPVIVFAQLRSQNKEGHMEFKDRVENDRTIYNHAFQAIEIVPDFEALQSKFVIHKNRFGYQQGQILEAKFVDGRFEPLVEESL